MNPCRQSDEALAFRAAGFEFTANYPLTRRHGLR